MVYVPSTIVINTKNGLPGRRGDPGPSNVLTIGTVTQGTAAATITGDPPNQVLNLVLPKGDPGAPGSPTPYELRGTGMPEGVVTASPGAYYTDTAGTNGAWRWLKTTGTGNTGWRPIVADTGWRDIASLLTAASITFTGTIALRRELDRVTYRFRNFAVSAGGSFTEPTGFVYPTLGAGNYPEALNINRATNTAGTVYIGQVNRFSGNRIQLLTFATAVSGEWSFALADAWPSVIPGTATT